MERDRDSESGCRNEDESENESESAAKSNVELLGGIRVVIAMRELPTFYSERGTGRDKYKGKWNERCWAPEGSGVLMSLGR
jgi:hypothetical protein